LTPQRSKSCHIMGGAEFYMWLCVSRRACPHSANKSLRKRCLHQHSLIVSDANRFASPRLASPRLAENASRDLLFSMHSSVTWFATDEFLVDGCFDLSVILMQSEIFSMIDLSVLVGFAITGLLVLIVVALLYIGRQIRANVDIAKGQFLLELERGLIQHDRVSKSLRSGGTWAGPGDGPKTIGEWAAVEDYMRFLEHCEVYLREGYVDRTAFSRIFRARVEDVVRNERIRAEQLAQSKNKRTTFIALMQRLGITPPRP
jgi:hypothetical protein